ncbi:hypothetical protein QUF58_01435 [Anaerolineales bacterium HSG24]|nr:hypothetical protein [Anaerolineales bacterium HSG24]
MNQLNNPCLSLYGFFRREIDKEGQEIKDSTARRWGEALANRLEVVLRDEHDQTPPEPDQNLCQIYHHHDTTIVYASVDQKESQPLTAWQTIGQTLLKNDWADWVSFNQQLLGDWPKRSDNYWGMSLIFTAEVSTMLIDGLSVTSLLPMLETAETSLESLESPLESLLESPLLSAQPWGKAWQLTETEEPFRIWAVLVEDTADLIHLADKVLFTQGYVDMLSLSLHKSYQQWHQYESERNGLQGLIKKLDISLKQLLKDEHPQRQQLTRVSNRYVDFVDLASRVAALRNTIFINSTNYEQLCQNLKLDVTPQDDMFAIHQRQLAHYLLQLDADRAYYEAAMQRFDTGLQTVRANLELILVEQEQQAAQKEKRRDLFLVLIGLWIGVTEICGILDTVLELSGTGITSGYDMLRLQANILFFSLIIAPPLLFFVWLLFFATKKFRDDVLDVDLG